MNKKTILGIAVIALTVIVAFTACSKSGGGSGGGKSLNSATELREYLDKQPANGPDKPIKVAMKANEMMIGDIAAVIKGAGKYVSLDLSGSPLTEIPRWAFYNVFDPSGEGIITLVGVTIPNGVTSIRENAFANTGLTSVTIPNSVTEIEYGAFSGCYSLTSITVDSDNPNYASEGGILYNKAKTEIVQVPRGISGNVTIPNGVTSIRNGAFYGTGLTSVTIPNSVTTIGGSAFFDCESLTSVTIPASVTSIGENAFQFCDSLISVTFQGVMPSVFYGNSFGGKFGSLYYEYDAGGIGTYTRTAGTDEYGNPTYTWTKQ